MQETKKHYSVTGGPKGSPILGVLKTATRDPLGFLSDNALRYGDIIPYRMLGRKVVQVNHPDIVKYVLVENHKNYGKSKGYIRFESVLGQGLPTSNGDKWKRDRQKIQPMFRREQVEGYHFEVTKEVTEKFKKRWLALTGAQAAEIDITKEMASITLEIIVKIIFGKDNLDEATVRSLYDSYGVFTHYLKKPRLLPKVDMRKLFRTPAYRHFRAEMTKVEQMFERLMAGYESSLLTDKHNMLALLIEAQKQNPELFSARDIRDQTFSMVFAGYETTAVLMQWMWHALDAHPDAGEKLYAEIMQHTQGGPMTLEAVNKMTYLSAIFEETMRLYPPFWVTGRETLSDDMFGDYKVERGAVVILPQMVMQRHPRFWDAPNAFIPERFLGDAAKNINDGAYFPFSHGPRKCIGYKVAEMEAKVVFAMLFPYFRVKILNALANGFDPGVSLQPQFPLRVEIRRRGDAV